MTNLYKYKMCGELTVPPSGKLIYLMLLESMGTNNKIVVPHRHLSGTIGLSRGTVSRNLRRLEAMGYIHIQPQYNEYGGRMPNKYTLK